MDKFAKIFETKTYGQILVKLDSSDDGPEVRFYCQPEDLGVCSIATQFGDNNKGWDGAGKFFDIVDIEAAKKMVAPIFSATGE